MAQLVELAKELLESGKVSLIIGYTAKGDNATYPFIAHTAADAEKLVFNHHCVNNLSVYINRLDIPEAGKIGIVVKGCDVRAVSMLIQESQIKRENVYIIGVNCNGVVKDVDMEWKKENVAQKCAVCEVRTPKLYDELVGELEEFDKPEPTAMQIIDKIEAMTPKERWAFWQEQFDKCIKCYACRQVCPLCYCDRCIVDENTPQWIETSATARGNFSWNIIRALHQSGRCVGCGECSRVCPMGIPIGVLNLKMNMISMSEFGFKPGMDINEPTLIGSYKFTEKENFIR